MSDPFDFGVFIESQEFGLKENDHYVRDCAGADIATTLSTTGIQAKSGAVPRYGVTAEGPVGGATALEMAPTITAADGALKIFRTYDFHYVITPDPVTGTGTSSRHQGGSYTQYEGVFTPVDTTDSGSGSLAASGAQLTRSFSIITNTDATVVVQVVTTYDSGETETLTTSFTNGRTASDAYSEAQAIYNAGTALASITPGTWVRYWKDDTGTIQNGTPPWSADPATNGVAGFGCIPTIGPEVRFALGRRWNILAKYWFKTTYTWDINANLVSTTYTQMPPSVPSTYFAIEPDGSLVSYDVSLGHV